MSGKRLLLVDEPYRRWVGQKPCIVPGCGRPPPIGGENDPHHPRGLEWGTGTSIKASDYFCIPICKTHHDLYHHKGRLSSGLPSHAVLLRDFWRRYGCPVGYTLLDIPNR